MKKLVTTLSKRLLLLSVTIGAFTLMTSTAFAGTISSGANQAFAKNQIATAISTITITEDAGDDMSDANDIRIRIPINMKWDATVTVATLTDTTGNAIASGAFTAAAGGACAASPCNVTVTYEVSDSILKLDVTNTANLVNADAFTITGLSYKTFSAASANDNLDLCIDGSCTAVEATDDKTIGIGAPAIAQAAATTYAKSQADTAISNITVADDSSVPVINATDDLRITIPTALGTTWEEVTAGSNTSQIVVTSAAFAKINATDGGAACGASPCTVTAVLEDSDRTLKIDVRADFAAEEAVTIASDTANGRFSTFNVTSGTGATDTLDLEVANDATVVNVAAEAVNVGAPTLVSSAAQTFFTGMSSQPLSWTMTITEGTAAPSINTTDDIIIRIPTAFNMQFDPSDTSVVVAGTDFAKVEVSEGGAACGATNCPVTVVFRQADASSACTGASGSLCKVMRIPVDTAWAASDDITVTGALLFGFDAVSAADNLELETAGADFGTTATDEDSVTITVSQSSSAASNDKTGPAAPTGFAVSDQGVLTWTDPTASDLKEIEVLKGVGNDPVSGVPVAIVAKGLGTYTDASVTVGQTVKYILRAKDTSNNYSANTDTVTAVIAPPPAEVEPIEPITVDLMAIGESGQSGTATLTEADGAVTVEVVVNDPDTDTTGTTQQAHIHSGTCAETGDVAHDLNDLVDGMSTTVLEMTLAELELEGPNYVNVHDATDATVSTACGDLYASATPTPEEVAPPEETVEGVTPDETGTVVAETTVKGANESAYATVSAGTALTTADGAPYTGTFTPPTVKEGEEVTPPEGAALASEVYSIGGDEGITASQPVTVYLPVKAGFVADMLKVYKIFKVGSDEPSATCTVVTSGEATLFRCELTSFSDYVILEFEAPVEEEDMGAEEEEEEEMEEAPFTDTTSHWSKDYVADLYAKGIVSGKTTTKYAPDDAVTRAEFTKIIVGAFGIDMVSTTGSFTDISGHWGSKYIEAAKAAGVISGYSDKTFKPDAEINRAEALKILLEAADVSLTAAAADFSDVKASDWFAKYVNYAAANVIVKGYADGTFGPNRSITRGEVAKIVSLMIAE